MLKISIEGAKEESKRLKTEWADRYGLKESKRSQVCICPLYGAKGCKKYICQNVPPQSDHATLWNLNGKPTVFVMQPYGPIRADSLVLWCRARSTPLEVNINTWPAWHYAGHVLHVEIATLAGFKAIEEARQKRLVAEKSK